MAEELRPFSPITTSANCSPTRASPRASRIPISWSTPAAAISSSRSTRSAWRPRTCRSSWLMEHLHARGITCPQPVKTRRGEVLGRIAGRPAAIITFLDGMWIRRPSPAHCAARRRGAREAASGGLDFAMRRANALSVAGWRPLFDLRRARRRGAARPLERSSRPSCRISKRAGRATCRTASSTPICFPTTCSSSATSCPG